MGIQAVTITPIEVKKIDQSELKARLVYYNGIGAIPADCETICQMADNLSGTIGVILSGQGPVWLFGALVHHAHATPWVATLDPDLDLAVVVESHCSNVNLGDVLAILV